MVKGFKFSLDKLLDIRTKNEEESKRNFTNTQREYQLVTSRLDGMKENYSKYNSMDPSETVVYRKIKKSYLMALTSSIKETEKEVEIKERELEYRRNDLKRKQVEKKTVEILKEKKLNEFIKEQDRIEQINNDEFALYAFMKTLERR